MKITERILLVILILALAMKFAYLPGADILLILSIGILSIVYSSVGFALFNGIGLRDLFSGGAFKNTNAKKIIGAIATGFALSITTLGILFKIQSYPGANVMLYTGLVLLGIILIIVLLKMIKNRSRYYTRILIKVLAFGLFALLLLFTPSKTRLTLNFPNHPEYVQALIDLEKDPGNDALIFKVEEERSKMIEEQAGMREKQNQ